MLFNERGVTDGRYVIPGRQLYCTGDRQTKPLPPRPPSLTISVLDKLPGTLDVSMRNVSTRQSPKPFGISERLYGTNAAMEDLLGEDPEPASHMVYQLLKEEYMEKHPNVQEHELHPRHVISGHWTL